VENVCSNSSGVMSSMFSLFILGYAAFFAPHPPKKVLHAFPQQLRDTPSSMRRNRVDPKSFDLTTPCPQCGYKIPPAEMMRLDRKHMHCPKCGKDVKVTTEGQAVGA